MSDPFDPTKAQRISRVVAGDEDLIDEDPELDDDDAADPLDIGYRGRGRPRLPPDQRRREKLVIALTGDELRRFMIAAAKAEGGPLRVQDWARRELLGIAKEEKP